MQALDTMPCSRQVALKMSCGLDLPERFRSSPRFSLATVSNIMVMTPGLRALPSSMASCFSPISKRRPSPRVAARSSFTLSRSASSFWRILSSERTLPAAFSTRP